MASISSLTSPTLTYNPFQKIRTIKPNSDRISVTKTFAARREAHNNFNGKLVDESLIVLRKRIHETEMMERNYEAPEEWMDWEKQFYTTNYDSIICDAMGHLQSYLMDTRPSLVLGMSALIALSVPISTVVVMFNLIEIISKGLLSGIHL